jgi:hypothetical protein
MRPAGTRHLEVQNDLGPVPDPATTLPHIRRHPHEREARDFYPTPPRATECLLKPCRCAASSGNPVLARARAKVIADAGYAVLASDLVGYDDCVFPILTGADALETPLSTGVKTIVPTLHTENSCFRGWSRTGSICCAR